MPRIPELDAIRGLAALGVVLFHAYPSQFFLGWSCVDLFFVLSGFLITSIILKEMDGNNFLKAFYLRRILRIWPVYYATLAGVLIVNSLSRSGYPTSGLAQHLLFLQNIQGYWGGHIPEFVAPFSPSWSVACEEQYYLVWPVIILVFGRKIVPWAATLLVLIGLIGRINRMPTDLLLFRGDGLAMGSLLAFLMQRFSHNERSLFMLRRGLFAGAVITSLWIFRYAKLHWMDPYPREATWAYFVLSLFFFCVVGLIAMHTNSSELRLLRSTSFRHLGTVSYALYMMHLPIMNYAPKLLEMGGIGSITQRSISTWALVFVIPSLSWFFMEKPLSRFKPSYHHDPHS